MVFPFISISALDAPCPGGTGTGGISVGSWLPSPSCLP